MYIHTYIYIPWAPKHHKIAGDVPVTRLFNGYGTITGFPPE